MSQALLDVTAPPETAEVFQSPRRRSKFKMPSYKFAPAAIYVFLAIFGPLFAPWSGTSVVGSPNLVPNGTYLFGTDGSGLDVLSRVIDGTRNDLIIAGMTVLLATVVGIIVGLFVGMNESRRGPFGIIARGVSRGLDLLQAIPAIVIGLVLVAFFGRSLATLGVALSVILAPNQARLVRTEVLRVRSEAYLDAARMAGETEFALTVRHVLPNASWPAMENSSVVFGAAILLTATLGFLGVGLHPPTPEWGAMISTAASDALVGRWWSGLFPALAITGCVYSFSVAGQHLFGRK
jgi:peptide/nickel transport system permease protein